VDKVTKVLLAAVVVLLVALLLRPQAGQPSAAHAQTPAASPAAAPILAVDNGIVYVLKGDRLDIYYLDPGKDPLAILDPAKRAGAIKGIQLHPMLSRDLSQLRTAAAP
jgi:hypothetical protein